MTYSMSTKQKRTPGLVKRGETWHIDKWVRGRRLCESAGTSDRAEAERYLARKLEEMRQAEVYGVRPRRTFRQAATKHLNESRKASIADDAKWLKQLDPFIGDLALDAVHMGALTRFIEARRAQGAKTRTINHALKVVRHILRLASDEWLDEYGLTWLPSVPKIKLLPEHDLRKPYPLVAGTGPAVSGATDSPRAEYVFAFRGHRLTTSTTQGGSRHVLVRGYLRCVFTISSTRLDGACARPA